MSKVVWIVAPIHKLRVPSIQYICHYGFTLSVVVLGSATNIQVLDEVESAVTKSFPEDSERCHNGLVGVGSVINYDPYEHKVQKKVTAEVSVYVPRTGGAG